jgi:hypothetical protein
MGSSAPGRPLAAGARRLTAPLAFLLSDCSDTERAARCRELRALALVYCGSAHPATTALGAAISDPAATDRALTVLDALPALRRRRLLASYGALMTRPTRANPWVVS